jgi:hypothetical protein
MTILLIVILKHPKALDDTKSTNRDYHIPGQRERAKIKT